MTTHAGEQADLLDLAAPAERAGFRLHRLQLLNWGTFDQKVWTLDTRGETSLLTGDIGSGKSTIVDALTTLLIAPQRIAYNKAAGAEARERSARSYFFGHYKAERSETGSGARPVALRDTNSYSVLLAHFFNEGYQEHVTLAQVFWMKEPEGQPARLFAVADRALSIAEHFARFKDPTELRRRLKTVTKELHDSYPPYQAAFRKRLGIVNDQAFDLFHQTVSMKSVGNLTDFVRQHMLQPFPVEERISQLIAHVDDLTRAHEAVLKAKEQVRRLTPLVEDCDRHDSLTAKVTVERACRDALKSWLAAQRLELLVTGLAECTAELGALTVEVDQAEHEKRRINARRDDLKQDIARNGGERLERLRRDLEDRAREKTARERRAADYEGHAALARLPSPEDAQAFQRNAREATEAQPRLDASLAAASATMLEHGVTLKEQRRRYEAFETELASLRKRRSNLPADVLAVRARLCQALGVAEDELPFAGELMQVRDDERAWEGAIERVLRSFGTSMLVTEEHYAAVSRWVEQTHLGARLQYLRVKEGKQARTPPQQPASLARKVEVKHGAPLADWVEGELARRFNLSCCETMAEFQREPSALTKQGQVKDGAKHVKDDRSRIDDRTRYVLGWSNQEKIAALETERALVAHEVQRLAAAISDAQAEERRQRAQLDALKALATFRSFEDLDWRQCVLELQRLEGELRELEKASDKLHALEQRLIEVEGELRGCEERLGEAREARARADERKGTLERALRKTQELVDGTSAEAKGRFGQLEALRAELGKSSALTIDNAEAAEASLRDWLQARIDADDLKLSRLAQKIVSAMQEYRNAYPLETRETDASVQAAREFRNMLAKLRSDDLPRFERRFKELLNENTIREVASFQTALSMERQTITERIEVINKSLKQIPFNAGRFILLESARATDAEVRDFQQDLKACTEQTLTGSGDETYSEAKFLQVKKIIERFRGREGSTDLDQKWTRKVTDVRNWFSFSASERWAETGLEHEHYTDSGGKSGGQKEKLAYTVLAASLAYQFGLEWGESKSRSFRFVVIDEAFGRGSDDSATYGLELFQRLNLQLLVVTPLQKIHVIEPFVANVGFVSNSDGESSKLRNLTIEAYRAEKALRGA